MWYFVLTVALSALYLYLRYVYSYWDRVGIPNFKPSIPYGNLKPVIQKKLSFGMTISELYTKTTEPFIGLYLFFRPAILVRDPELIHKILITDFSSFHDRGVYCEEERDPFSGNLFSLPGAKWRVLRNQITPTMTSGKMKSMYETITNVSNSLSAHLKPHADNKSIVDLKEFATRYSLDIVGNVIFGLDFNTLDNPKHDFRQIHQKLTVPDFLTGIRGACSFLCPELLKFLHISPIPSWVKKWLVELITSTIEAREQENFTRKDFMQLMIQLRNTGKIADDNNWNINENEKLKELKFSIEQCAGQLFVFYIAGSETSASAISYCLHELTQHPDYLVKVQQEIDDGLKNHNGEITYELLNELPFLEMCLQETLRKYPGLPILNRICTKDFEDPQTNFKVQKGMQIIIPLYGMQRDALHFRDPELFDPYRFEEGRRDFDEKCYMPFGDGPHICIGVRMAKVVTKVALIKLLSIYNFEMITKGDPEYEPSTVAIISKDGIKLKITNRAR